MRRPGILLHGTVIRPCGFTLINRRLIAGLRDAGFSVAVIPNDGEPTRDPSSDPPDIYLFHGDPFDFETAPGRINAFFLQWEYRRIERDWVDRLHENFDVLLVPSGFCRRIAEQSGVRIPIRVCPGAVDRSEFHPGVSPVPLPTRKSFRFICLGGAHERRGIDVLLEAYGREFTAADDVALVLKGFHYEHHRQWVETKIDAARAERGGEAPEIVYVHGFEDSIAGYFAAADVGVFPVRAECLGLPVLECLASGRPVIVTRDTGLDEFCNATNARFLRAREALVDGKHQLEPSVTGLRALMREAFDEGKPDRELQARVSASVERFEWGRSVALMAGAITDAWEGRDRPRRTSPASPRSIVASTGRALRPFRTSRDTGPSQAPARVLIGVEAPPRALRTICAREREAMGVPLPRRRAMASSIRAWELRLADRLLVPSELSARSFLDAGWDPDRVRVLRPAFPPAPDRDAPSDPDAGDGPGRPPRFLFATRRPFVAGLRILIEAWDLAGLRAASLECRLPDVALHSEALLRFLIAHSEVRVGAPPVDGHLGEIVERADCVVLPSLFEGHSAAGALAMSRGKPVIASAGNGLAETLTDGRDGWVVAPGSVAELAGALVAVAGDADELARVGRAARATAARLGPERYRSELADLSSGIGRA